MGFAKNKTLQKYDWLQSITIGLTKSPGTTLINLTNRKMAKCPPHINEFQFYTTDPKDRFKRPAKKARAKTNFRAYISSKLNEIAMNKVWDNIYNRTPNYRDLDALGEPIEVKRK